jgi:hypothetical protein
MTTERKNVSGAALKFMAGLQSYLDETVTAIHALEKVLPQHPDPHLGELLASLKRTEARVQMNIDSETARQNISRIE